MPIPITLLASRPSLTTARPDEAPGARRAPGTLAAAVAAIVAIAAQRARAGGTLDALREAVEAALDAATPAPPEPRDGEATDLPRIADADPVQEERRLRALFARMQPG